MRKFFNFSLDSPFFRTDISLAMLGFCDENLIEGKTVYDGDTQQQTIKEVNSI